MSQPTKNPIHADCWRSPFDAYTLAFAAMLAGAVLWNALFPGFYYMDFIFFVTMLWMSLATVVFLRLLLASIASRRTGRPVVWAGWLGVATLLCVVSVAILLKLPLHAAFAFARSELDRAIEQDRQPGETFPLANSSYGIYSIYQQAQRRCHHEERIYFTLANDAEAAFVYSPSGIDDLCYNSGTKGHLSGDWYWIAED